MSEGQLELVPRARLLTADDLELGTQAMIRATHASNAPDAPRLAADDPTLLTVRRLLPNFGGIIFTGPPGTGKTFKASQIAEELAQGTDRVRYVQFHPSYQYDEFMEGFVPTSDGFAQRPGVFLAMCQRASEDPDNVYVLVIDELSRADAARVFGEALTYVDRTKRGQSVVLASGTTLTVPNNFEILATMNPIDRGVDDVDAAFERRFAKIKVDPDRGALEEILSAGGLQEDIRGRVLAWFERMKGKSRDNPAAAVGHAYFISVDGVEALRDVWEYQLQFAVERAFRLDPETRAEMEQGWRSVFAGVEGGWDGAGDESGFASSDAPA